MCHRCAPASTAPSISTTHALLCSGRALDRLRRAQAQAAGARGQHWAPELASSNKPVRPVTGCLPCTLYGWATPQPRIKHWPSSHGWVILQESHSPGAMESMGKGLGHPLLPGRLHRWLPPKEVSEVAAALCWGKACTLLWLHRVRTAHIYPEIPFRRGGHYRAELQIQVL